MAGTPSDIRKAIAETIRQKDAGILDAQRAGLKALEALQQDTLAQVARASTEWQKYYYPKHLRMIEDAVAGWKARSASGLYSAESDIWALGVKLFDKPARDAGIASGMPVLSQNLLDQIHEFGRIKLSGVGDAALDKIRTELYLGMTGSRSAAEVIKAIGSNLTDPSIFGSIRDRALTIYKHEAGTAFSSATQARLAEAAKEIKDLYKEWKHSGHPKVARTSHLEADGQMQKVDEPYKIGLSDLMFPRDPAGDLEETMNCGCDSWPWHPAWAVVD